MPKRKVVEAPGFAAVAGTRPRIDREYKGAQILRDWQARAWEALHPRRCRILIGPTGSGKSKCIKAISHSDLLQDARAKVVIAVPQHVIGRGFKHDRLTVARGAEPFEWDAGHKLLGDSAGSVQKLIDFLTAKPGTTLASRVLVCTHQTLVLAHQRLGHARRKKSPWSGVSLFIDETHHAQASEDEALSNRLGKLIGYWLDNDPGPLLLTTATWMRANLDDIVPPSRIDRFTTYQLTVDEYVASMNHLREIVFRFIIGTPEDAIRTVFAEGTGKTAIYMPHSATALVKGRGGKDAVLESYVGAIGRSVRADDWTATVRSKRGRVRIVDMVTPAGRNRRRDCFMETIGATPEESVDEPDAMIAMNIGKEGFDWPALERVIVIGERGSIPDVLQMLGRLLRDYPGKERVEFTMVLPGGGADDDAEQVRRYLTTIICSMVIEQQFRAPEPGETATQRRLRADLPAAARVIGKMTEAVIEGRLGGGADGEVLGVSQDEIAAMRPLFSARSRALREMAGRFGPVVAIEQDDAFGCIRMLAKTLGHESLAVLREAANTALVPVSEQEMRAAIHGMGVLEYKRRRAVLGDGYCDPSHFHKLYGKTYRQVRDDLSPTHRKRGRRTATPVSAAERAEFKRLYDQGLSSRDIEAVVGRASAVINKALRMDGHATRGHAEAAVLWRARKNAPMKLDQRQRVPPP